MNHFISMALPIWLQPHMIHCAHNLSQIDRYLIHYHILIYAPFQFPHAYLAITRKIDRL